MPSWPDIDWCNVKNPARCQPFCNELYWLNHCLNCGCQGCAFCVEHISQLDSPPPPPPPPPSPPPPPLWPPGSPWQPIEVKVGEAVRLPLFLGFNLPWKNFGYDITDWSAFDYDWFATELASVAALGANAVRFWLHADGRGSPIFSDDGHCTGMGGLDGLRQLASLARSNGLLLQICLWSFDLCRSDAPGIGLRSSLITDESKAQSYIDLALLPMLEALGDDPNVVIEIMNEVSHLICCSDLSRAARARARLACLRVREACPRGSSSVHVRGSRVHPSSHLYARSPSGAWRARATRRSA